MVSRRNLSETIGIVSRRLAVSVAVLLFAVNSAFAQCEPSSNTLDIPGTLNQILMLPSGGGFSAGWTTSTAGDKDVIVSPLIQCALPPCGVCASRCDVCQCGYVGIALRLPGSDEIPVRILAQNDDEAVVVAQQFQNSQPCGVVTIKVTVSNGQPSLAWSRQVGCAPNLKVKDAALLPNGDILIAASAQGTNGKDWHLITIDGRRLDPEILIVDGGYGDDEPTSIAIAGNVAFVGGYVTTDQGNPTGIILRYGVREWATYYRSTHPDTNYITNIIADKPAQEEFIAIGAKRGASGFDPYVVTYHPTAGAREEDLSRIRQLDGQDGDYYPADMVSIPVPGTSLLRHLLIAVYHVPPQDPWSQRPPRTLLAQRSWRSVQGGWAPVHGVRQVPIDGIPVSFNLEPRSDGTYDWALLSFTPQRGNPNYSLTDYAIGSWDPDVGLMRMSRWGGGRYFFYSLPPDGMPGGGLSRWRSGFFLYRFTDPNGNTLYRYTGGYFLYRIPDDSPSSGSQGQIIQYGTDTPNNPHLQAFFVPTPARADVDGNCCIDDADLLAVLFAFGNQGFGLMEDINLDGVVDDADLLEVLFNFGTGC